MINNHLRKLSRDPRFCRAHKLISIEANMSYIGADQVANWCQADEFQPVIIESRDSSSRNRVGVWTGPYEKETYAWLLRDIVENDKLHFAADMISANADKNKETLISQLRQFRMERMDPKDVTFGKFKYAYTGKTAGGNKDDLVLALMIATYWGSRKREDVEFQQWAKANGYRLD